MKWTLKSYRILESLQQPFQYTDPIFSKLRGLVPIVERDRIDKLKEQLMEAEHDKRIVFSGGDCAESFQEANSTFWDRKVEMYKKFDSVLSNKFNKKSLIIGRVAGQYGKPRSNDFSIVNGQKIYTYKGDNVNDHADIKNRQPSSKRLLDGYYHSFSTYSYLKDKLPSLFISHEGLILPYEQSLTYQIDNKYYCQSAHMLWIGQRTRQLTGGHVQFFRGIENPIGVKISTNITKQQFLDLVRTLNPKNQNGKLIIIIRAGQNKVNELITQLQEIKKNNKLNFLFMSDPMHANTFQSPVNKLKTRNIKNIQKELNNVFGVLKQQNLPCGMMFECTPQDVTECFGDSYIPTQNQLNPQFYRTKCDPRLNSAQLEHVIRNIQY